MLAFWRVRAYYIRTEDSNMPETIAELRELRSKMLREMGMLGEFRSGSITPTSGRCGKSNCVCHTKGHPGHSAHYRLTFKVKGKSVTQALSSNAEIDRAHAEVEEFRKFQALSRAFIEVNARICERRREEAKRDLDQSKKKRGRRSIGR